MDVLLTHFGLESSTNCSTTHPVLEDKPEDVETFAKRWFTAKEREAEVQALDGGVGYDMGILS